MGAEQIAIIGMGCRLPGGVDSPAEYWDLLRSGGDAIGEVPQGRWEGQTGAAAVPTTGGFRHDTDGFDAPFFGISPREAALIDPQQRMVLEVSWEALEHAGVVPQRLAGGDCGVFIGVNADDHGRRLLADPAGVEAWTGIGSSLCGVANRVSYALDLRGPSLAVDTACSASLVAIHLACQSLRCGETSVALAGGVMVMDGPALTAVMAAAGALSPSGRSRPFDAAADGYVRGEGAGVLVLKRLSAAARDGDRVLAVIRGGAVHQEGHTDGIMAPGGAALEHLLRRAYASSGIAPTDVDYVEAHGTGTRAGDPVEAGSLGAVLGAGRTPDRPCLVGSVKGQIGHLEAASGVAGVIKVVLAMRHGTIPATAFTDRPDPRIPWERDGLRIVTEPTAWPETGRPRRAGVSSAGYGGTIAHLVLEQAPARQVPHRLPDGRLRVYPLSGASPAAVTAAAERLAGTGAPLADVAHTLAHRRSHLRWRAAVVAAGREELDAALARVRPREADPGVAPVWVFSGHGSQWPGMGRELLRTEPVFAAALDRLAPWFAAEGSPTPRELLADDELDTAATQSAIVAVQLALAALWRAYGVTPAAVIGHSVGEITAAVVAGALSERDGALLVCRRSRLLRTVAGTGAMAMVGAGAREAAALVRDEPNVAVAITAAPRSTVLSGDPAALTRLLERWRAGDGPPARLVATDIAFHSPAMEPLAPALARAAGTVSHRVPHTPLYSTALDDPRDGAPRDGAYWATNLRRPVRFREAVEAAAADGHRLFLEVSPHPVVAHSIVESAPGAAVAYTLRRGHPERKALLGNLAELYTHGVAVDWTAIQPDGELADLPTTAWQHRDYRAASAPRGPGGHDPRRHDLLGTAITVHGTSRLLLWQTTVDEANRPYPGRHPVLGTEIVPAAVLLRTLYGAAVHSGSDGTVADVRLRTPVPVGPAREVQVALDDGTVRLSSRPLDGSWLTHATASVRPAAAIEPLGVAAAGEHVDPGFVVSRLAALGVADMGFDWTVERLTRDAGDVRAVVVADSPAAALDAALSLASVAFAAPADPGTPASMAPAELRMPASIERADVRDVRLRRAVIGVRSVGPDTVDVDVTAEDGRTVARLRGLFLAALSGVDAPRPPHQLVHRIDWRPREEPPRSDVDGITLVTDDPRGHSPLAAELRRLGTPCTVVADPDELADPPGSGRDGDARMPGGVRTVVVAPRAAAATGRQVGVAAYQAAWLLLRTVRALAGTATRLWCLTRGVREDELAHASLYGVARVVAGEHPELWGGVVDLPGTSGDGAADLLAVLRGGPVPDVVAPRDGVELVPRLAPVTAASGPGLRCRPEATYLIVGGLGALGRQVAHRLVDRGARRLILVGRRPLPPRTAWDGSADPRVEAVLALEARGVTVRAVALDITDRVQAAKMLDPDELGLPDIRGVVHAAGVLDNRLAVDVDAGSLTAVMRPKVAGALVLHEVFPPGSLDFLALFSSAGPLLGLPGQASYAAANAFLDALAAHRADTISLSWTSWRGLGMSTSDAGIDAELAARGTGDITAAEAFGAWDHAIRSGARHVAVLRTVPLVPGARRPALLADLDDPGADLDDPGQAAPAARPVTGDLRAEVTALVADELRIDAGDLDPSRPLAELGVDSLLTQVIRRRIERAFGVSVPATLLWRRPTVRAVTDHLAEILEGAA